MIKYSNHDVHRELNSMNLMRNISSVDLKVFDDDQEEEFENKISHLK